MGSDAGSNQLTPWEQKRAFFETLVSTTSVMNPQPRLESVAYLLAKIAGEPRYEFRLSAGRPSSWSFMIDLSAFNTNVTVEGAESPDGSQLHFKLDSARDDRRVQQFTKLLERYEPRKLDYLAGLVFVRDLLLSTGRAASDEAVIQKYWETLPPKTRPPKEELPFEDARQFFALAA